jgi:GntR family transcriptional regulator
MIEIDISSPEPIFEQIVSQIGVAVVSEVILEGDKLPPIRQIAKDLEINANTVAKAYQILEEALVIKTRGRSGSFVSKNAPLHYEKWLSEMMRRDLLSVWHKLQAISSDKKMSKKIWKEVLINFSKETDNE